MKDDLRIKLSMKHADIVDDVWFECGDGWFALLDDLLSKLEALGEQIKATQIKEKYGTLRFYHTGGSDAADKIVSAAEDASANICETCGAPGKLRGQSWLYTACDACHSKRSSANAAPDADEPE